MGERKQPTPAPAAAPAPDYQTVPLLVPGTMLAVQIDDWFAAPDGQQYKTLFGPCYAFSDVDAIGIKTKNGAGWFLQVGNETPVIVAGCRIHYATVTTVKPLGSSVLEVR